MKSWRSRLIQRPISNKKVKEFSKRIEVVTALLDDLFTKPDVPKFLTAKHLRLSDKNPLEVIWKDGEKGFEKVVDLIESIMTGDFS